MDIGAVLKAKQAWETFKENHPKFEPFLMAVKQRGIKEGTVITVEVKYDDDTRIKSNIRVNSSDMELLDLAKQLLNK